MPVLGSYARFRFLWGGADVEVGSGQYPSDKTDSTSLGASAAAGDGVGVRRCVVHFDRTALVAGEDDAEMHFDFLNITGGDPDDTWITSDYTTLEDLLDDFFDDMKNYFTPGYKVSSYNWYRYGPDVVKPNPAERVVTRAIVGVDSAHACPPQCASTFTFRTGIRRSWGRTYLPAMGVDYVQAAGDLSSGTVDAWAASCATLYEAANDADFPMVVVSKKNRAVYAIEAIEVDSTVDIIRRRRFSHTAYRKIINT